MPKKLPTKYSRLTASVPEDFMKLVKELEILGYTTEEMIKSGIRMLHRKELSTVKVLGKIKSKDIADELTDEELCTEVFHGTIEEEGGIKVCKIKDGNFTDTIPLSALRGQIPK